MTCPVCLQQTDQVNTCTTCQNRILHHLRRIETLIVEAHLQLMPERRNEPRPPMFGSRPPVNLDAVDPELALIELNQGDPSSAVTILEMLEMWERTIRELRAMTPYGPVSAQRIEQAHAPASDTTVSLRGCVGFLQAHHQWLCDDIDFPVSEYADHLRRTSQQLRRWDPMLEPRATRIPCPTTTDQGDCGYLIPIRSYDDHATCRRCQREWAIDRLITVAGRDADVWVDAEAVATIAGVHERTIRKWATAGKVAKRGQLYRLQDVKTIAEKLGA